MEGSLKLAVAVASHGALSMAWIRSFDKRRSNIAHVDDCDPDPDKLKKLPYGDDGVGNGAEGDGGGWGERGGRGGDRRGGRCEDRSEETEGEGRSSEGSGNDAF